MPAEFADMLDDTVTLDQSEEAANLICRCDQARTEAAYYRGLYEGAVETIAIIKISHEATVAHLRATIEALESEKGDTLAYLKDRLNKAEGRPGPAAIDRD